MKTENINLKKQPIVRVKYLQLGEVSIERRYVSTSDANKGSYFEDFSYSSKVRDVKPNKCQKYANEPRQDFLGSHRPAGAAGQPQ